MWMCIPGLQIRAYRFAVEGTLVWEAAQRWYCLHCHISLSCRVYCKQESAVPSDRQQRVELTGLQFYKFLQIRGTVYKSRWFINRMHRLVIQEYRFTHDHSPLCTFFIFSSNFCQTWQAKYIAVSREIKTKVIVFIFICNRAKNEITSGHSRDTCGDVF